ncbi:uncharacterized protein LOC105845754 isoform X2 [Hydra vulgaris]|uniref:Uncharacterized protein LOC105845754 isoform X2 n=1 Tax=Hydra vulgaris TaxID=6087 RepID=A0ABM4CF20_HYDVU
MAGRTFGKTSCQFSKQIISYLKQNSFKSTVSLQSITSRSLAKRSLSQFLPSFQAQMVIKYDMLSASTSGLGNSLVSKVQALQLALNETDVTSVDESEEDEEATLYILSDMFSVLNLQIDGG